MLLSDAHPLILTLALDPTSQAFFQEQRRQWFPPALNQIPAHVTLFHHLPGHELADIRATLNALCAQQPPSTFNVTGLRFLGRGVAYALHAPEAAAFRTKLAALWHEDLTSQDKQGWRPHVTIQNKVPPAEARALHDRLNREFTPFSGTITGVTLWHYLGGPWRQEACIPFSQDCGQ
jgi:hypothetical protein